MVARPPSTVCAAAACVGALAAMVHRVLGALVAAGLAQIRAQRADGLHLLAAAPQRVHLRALELVLDFDVGDGIWTESSYKFTRESVVMMLSEAGLALDEWQTDSEGRFGLAIARPREHT